MQRYMSRINMTGNKKICNICRAAILLKKKVNKLRLGLWKSIALIKQQEVRDTRCVLGPKTLSGESMRNTHCIHTAFIIP